MNRTARLFLLVTVSGLLSLSVVDRAQETANAWGPLEYLIGDWAGEGGGQPGQGGGEFSFQLDLQKRVLVRKSYAAYPAANGRPAFRHDDLTVVYRESENLPVKALYLDSEGHVIHYSVRASADQKTIEFVSDVLPSTPTYRLTYLMTGGNTLNIKFEIAPPGKPDAFSTYIEARAKRK
jgi:hypothetical protein